MSEHSWIAEFKELSDGSEFTYISEVAVKAVMQQ